MADVRSHQLPAAADSVPRLREFPLLPPESCVPVPDAALSERCDSACAFPAVYLSAGMAQQVVLLCPAAGCLLRAAMMSGVAFACVGGVSVRPRHVCVGTFLRRHCASAFCSRRLLSSIMSHGFVFERLLGCGASGWVGRRAAGACKGVQCAKARCMLHTLQCGGMRKSSAYCAPLWLFGPRSESPSDAHPKGTVRAGLIACGVVCRECALVEATIFPRCFACAESWHVCGCVCSGPTPTPTAMPSTTALTV